jgi:hypothetical protein
VPLFHHTNSVAFLLLLWKAESATLAIFLSYLKHLWLPSDWKEQCVQPIGNGNADGESVKQILIGLKVLVNFKSELEDGRCSALAVFQRKIGFVSVWLG